MHVLVIPSWYKSKINPVKGSFFEEQARGLQKKGMRVGVLCPLFTSFSSDEKSSYEEYVDNDLPTHILTIKGIVPKSISINYWHVRRLGYQAFKEYEEKYGRPDIIHAHTVYFGGIVAEYINRKTGIPFVITEHYSPFVRGKITGNKKLNVAVDVFKKADQAIVVSHSFRTDLAQKLNLSESVFKVIPNLVHPSFFKNNRTVQISEETTVTFFSNSFLSDVKNHRLMLDSFKIFINSHPQSKLIIGGDGILNKDLRQYTRQINLEDYVIFTGLLSREEVREKLNECHIFLSTSTYETFSVVLIEAAAVGRPVITTDSGGPRDIVDDRNGRIVSSWEPDDYAQEMQYVVNHYDSYDQQEISDYCHSRFSEEIVIQQLIEIYREVLHHVSKDNITIGNR